MKRPLATSRCALALTTKYAIVSKKHYSNVQIFKALISDRVDTVFAGETVKADLIPCRVKSIKSWYSQLYLLDIQL